MERDKKKIKLLTGLLFSVGKFASLPSNDKDFSKALFHRLQNPIVGDLVVEVSAFGLDYTEGAVGIFCGKLLDLEHPELEQQPEEANLWQIEAIDTGKVINWKNSIFRAIPTTQLIQEVIDKIQ